ncbi:NACHT domain-containing protein [Actinoplanes sp. CA-054009]
MRRSLLVVTVVVTVLLGTAQGLVVNYASEDVPAFFTDDPWRPWLILALVVAVLVIAALATAPPRPPEAAPPPSREARRLARLASVLWDDVHSLAVNEEWRDSQFTELEAEVEVEAPARAWFRRRAAARVQRLPSLTEALRVREDSLVILEGEPGAGKSIALRHLAATMADEVRRRPSERSVLPFYLNLKNLDVRAEVSAADVERFVRENLNPSRSRDIDRYLEERFDSDREQGRWLFLFDSFDEIPAILSATEAGPVIDAYVEAIAGFVGLGQSRAVIASREFRGPTRTGKPLLRVMPLSRARRERFIRSADLDPGDEQTLLDGVDGMGLQVQQLTDNPLFLSLLCEYVRNTGSLPQSAHAVIESYVRSRLTRDRDRIENRFAVDVNTTRRVAEELALLMLADPSMGLAASRSAITKRLTAQTAFSADDVESAMEALLYCHLVRYSETEARDRVTFAHRRLQEYFATCAVIRDESAVTPAQLLTDGRWRETAVVILQTQRAEHSVDLLSAIERRLWAAAGDQASLWPAGTLYLLDLMANALAPEDIAQHPVSRAANRILGRAWTEGSRLDQKWVIELCAAAGAEKAIGYLARGFASESMWLRDEAYRQVRRAGPEAATLEPEIRHALFDMSVDGRLRRERRSIRIQMQRLPFAGRLPQVVDLLLVGPAAAVVAGPLGIALLAPFASDAERLRLWAITPIAAVALLIGTWVFRLSRASDDKSEQLMRARFGRAGLDGETTQFALEGATILAVGMIAGVASLPTVEFIRSHRESPALVASASVAALAAVLVWLWPFGALQAGHDGRPTRLRHWPALSAVLVWNFLDKALRRLRSALSRRPSFDFPFWKALVRRVLSPKMIAPILIMAGIGIAAIIYRTVGLVLLLTILAGLAVTWVRRIWLRSGDRRVVSALIAVKAPGVPAVQEALDSLRTEDGIHLFLSEVRRHQLHRDPEKAAFLSFLGVALSRRPRREDLADQRPAWVQWWLARGSHHQMLMNQSSGAADELGRILEEAHRAGAFRE